MDPIKNTMPSNTDNNGKYFVGSMSSSMKKDGWFFGHFADSPLLKSPLVEVAWQEISNKKAEPKDKHVHKEAVEINIIISGSMNLLINDQPVSVKAGEFYVVWPGAIVDKVEAGDNTVDLVIKAPSVAGDKYYL